MKMSYTDEDFRTDVQWLIGQGLEVDEAEEFLLNTLTAGFSMTRKEYADFVDTIRR